MSFYVYFAQSLRNNKVYVGSTGKKPEDRVKEHNNGSNSWSKINKPLTLLYFEKYECKVDVRNRELFYKSGIGKAIKKLIVENINKLKGR